VAAAVVVCVGVGVCVEGGGGWTGHGERSKTQMNKHEWGKDATRTPPSCTSTVPITTAYNICRRLHSCHQPVTALPSSGIAPGRRESILSATADAAETLQNEA
jgi:hypothetical protein